jgi:hypothetical protein
VRGTRLWNARFGPVRFGFCAEVAGGFLRSWEDFSAERFVPNSPQQPSRRMALQLTAVVPGPKPEPDAFGHAGGSFGQGGFKPLAGFDRFASSPVFWPARIEEEALPRDPQKINLSPNCVARFPPDPSTGLPPAWSGVAQPHPKTVDEGSPKVPIPKPFELPYGFVKLG